MLYNCINISLKIISDYKYLKLFAWWCSHCCLFCFQLRANQEHHLQDVQKTEGSDASKDSSPNMGKPHQFSVSSEQARTNVINEIITAEREYVRQLDDVLQVKNWLKYFHYISFKRKVYFKLEKDDSVCGSLSVRTSLFMDQQPQFARSASH